MEEKKDFPKGCLLLIILFCMAVTLFICGGFLTVCGGITFLAGEAILETEDLEGIVLDKYPEVSNGETKYFVVIEYNNGAQETFQLLYANADYDRIPKGSTITFQARGDRHIVDGKPLVRRTMDHIKIIEKTE